jgi:hypothetical protein
VTAIWERDEKGWLLLSPSGFLGEAELHDLVEKDPQLLPLSGGPQLVVLGREVALSTGYADLIAIEPGGRVVIIEVKLASNAEARRAVVAQALAYAASLHRVSLATFESGILGVELKKRRFASIADAVAATQDDPDFSHDAFNAQVEGCLSSGRFRLVFVLDEVPVQLRTLVGYLEAMTEGLVIDLVTVAAYQVGDRRVVVPQRVTPGKDESSHTLARPARTGRAPSPVTTIDGTDQFLDRIARAPAEQHAHIRRLTSFIEELQVAGLARSATRAGPTYTSAKAIVRGYEVGMFTLYLEAAPELSLSVIRRLAPVASTRIEALLPEDRRSLVRCGVPFERFDADMIAAVRSAYEEAAGHRITADG